MKKYSLSIEDKHFDVEVNVEQDIAEVTVNGKLFNVKIEKSDEVVTKTSVVPKPAKTYQTNVIESSAPTKPKANIIKSPLPGSIVNILVSVGTKVKRGDVLVVLEAMKMENNIMADKDGVVKAVLTQAGKTVMMDDPLLEIE
ncbi:MAG: biotin/lipoyl-binding protein [Bacteroidales bacterium]|jgi:biotin carboxyl carrier protein|nr:biotin/lipoyl-binding protein [Bacteroidales bacterium]